MLLSCLLCGGESLSANGSVLGWAAVGTLLCSSLGPFLKVSATASCGSHNEFGDLEVLQDILFISVTGQS